MLLYSTRKIYSIVNTLQLTLNKLKNIVIFLLLFFDAGYEFFYSCNILWLHSMSCFPQNLLWRLDKFPIKDYSLHRCRFQCNKKIKGNEKIRYTLEYHHRIKYSINLSKSVVYQDLARKRELFIVASVLAMLFEHVAKKCIFSVRYLFIIYPRRRIPVTLRKRACS